MTVEKLLQERRIYRQKIASADILAVIARAENDIDSAQYMLERVILIGRFRLPTTVSYRLHAH